MHAQQHSGGATGWMWMELLLDTVVDPLSWPLAQWGHSWVGRGPGFVFFFISLVATILWAGWKTSPGKSVHSELVIQPHPAVWRREIGFIVVFSEDIIKQVSFGWCHFSLTVRQGWAALLRLCHNRVTERDERGKRKINFEVFLYCKKNNPKRWLVPPVCYQIKFCYLESSHKPKCLGFVQAAEGIAAGWSHFGQCRSSRLMLKAPQGHGEGTALPQHSPLSPWMFASLSPHSILCL